VSQLKNDEYDNTTGSLQLDYYYRDLALSLATSQYDYQSSANDFSADGQNDYYLSARYKIKRSENLSIYLKGGAIVPSNSDVTNNKTDYFISKSLNYKLNKNWNLFGGVNYTFVNNDDTDSTAYQNSLGRYAGFSYRPTYDATLSLSMSKNASIYKDEEDIEFVYFSGSYNFTKNWFGIVNLGKELQDDDKDTYGSLQVGYYF
jgi:predicted porin